MRLAAGASSLSDAISFTHLSGSVTAQTRRFGFVALDFASFADYAAVLRLTDIEPCTFRQGNVKRAQIYHCHTIAGGRKGCQELRGSN